MLPHLDEECRLPKGSDEELAKKVRELLAAAGHDQRKGRKEATKAGEKAKLRKAAAAAKRSPAKGFG